MDGHVSVEKDFETSNPNSVSCLGFLGKLAEMEFLGWNAYKVISILESAGTNLRRYTHFRSLTHY